MRETSESVTQGHPDKLCDQIGDAILDEYLRKDPDSRVAIEVTATPETLMVSGEVRSNAEVTEVDRQKTVRKVLDNVGYPVEVYDPLILDVVGEQSPEIASAVDGEELGAGDQGIAFGYATIETLSGMPLSMVLARGITDELTKTGGEYGFLPDGKAQVTVGDDGSTVVVASTQHSPDLTIEEVREGLEAIVEKVFKDNGKELDKATMYLQPAGLWTIGGPAADVGVLGRKVIVDSYGGAARHGGGAYSGKDSSKIDRSGAYAARQAALWLVKNGYADEAEVGLGWAIGVPDPVSFSVETFGTSLYSEEQLVKLLKEEYSFKVEDIIERLELKKPNFEKTAALGHFGRGWSWDRWSKIGNFPYMYEYEW